MNKQTQMLLGVGVVGVAAYLIWKSQQPKANQTGNYKVCGIYAGDVSVPIGTRVGNNGVIVATGGGRTVVCPIGQRYVMPTDWKTRSSNVSEGGRPKRNFAPQSRIKGGGLSEGCPKGMVQCTKNPKKCYDPNVNYVMNPCR